MRNDTDPHWDHWDEPISTPETRCQSGCGTAFWALGAAAVGLVILLWWLVGWVNGE